MSAIIYIELKTHKYSEQNEITYHIYYKKEREEGVRGGEKGMGVKGGGGSKGRGWHKGRGIGVGQRVMGVRGEKRTKKGDVKRGTG